MFTQCSKCETVFRLSAQALRAAGGQVRCGRCGEVFNALARLAENSAGFKKGESSLELETRADEILQSVEPAQEQPGPQPPGASDAVELKDPDSVDDEVTSEASLEFTLPPGELDRIFIETTPSVLQVLAVEAHHPERTPGIPPWTEATPRAPPASSPAQAPAPSPAAASAALAAASAAAAPPAAVFGFAAAPEASEQPIAASAAPDAKVAFPENAHREMRVSRARVQPAPINPPPRRLRVAVWASVSIVFAALLAIQVLLANRDWVAANAPLLGGEPSPAARLSSYQLRQWGVTGDPGATGALRVRASIMNTAAHLEPYPLLRVTLANRFGTRVAEREFEPSEYMGKATAHLLAPGERADALLDIVDPGKDAEGFEIDVCVRSADKKLVCAGDAPAAGGGTADAATQAK
ncbi:MAG: DUF3426 domain-containing protein [Steroidobacteraceae bacterium]